MIYTNQRFYYAKEGVRMIKIWIVGSSGQIGTAINEVLNPLEVEVFNTDKDELDITETDEVLNFGERSTVRMLLLTVRRSRTRKYARGSRNWLTVSMRWARAT